jgi:hypothetical protein
VNGADVNQTIAFTQGLPSTITIIPSSSTLALVPDASTPGPSETIGYANVTGDLWNIASNSVGNVTMTINQQGRLATSIGFSNASTGSNPANIVGYPHVVYGDSPWTQAKTTMSKALQLPIQLGNFPQFVSLANYSISLGSGSTPTPINFAYDIWITQNKSSSGCGVGDLELMIWTYNTNNLPAGAGGTFVASKQLPMYLDGSTQPVTWNIFVRDGNQSTGSFTTVYLVSSNPIGSGAVGIDIHHMIGEMIDALLVNYPGNWNNASLQNYWIEDIELGCEFGLLQSQATCSWNLNNYCYFLNYPPLANGASSFNYNNSQSTSTTGTTTINSGSASLNQLPATDISVSINGSSAQDGTNITVTSTDYGATQPPDTGTMQVSGVAFYDVKIISSSPLGSNAMTVVSITNPDFSAQDNVVSFWNGSSWITVPSQFIKPDTVRGTFFASTLAGTPIMAGTIQELPSILILPLFMVATLLTATIHRKSKRARAS